MITINVKEHNGVIQSLQISGHALYAEHGKDLVCAGVSSIGVGLLNALSELCEDSCELSMSDGNIQIQVINQEETNQIILKCGIIQLQTMEQSYKNYIQITKTEV